MNPNDAVRARVTAALQDIEHAQRDLGLTECDRGDLEVHRILARIERRLAKAREQHRETTP